jgi:predicted Zn finger-like uncharacterized protein
MMENGSIPAETVTCPKCDTRYRAPGGVIGGPAATYRCARCGHVFSPLGDPRPGEPRRRPSAGTDAPRRAHETPAEDEDIDPAGADGPAFVRGDPSDEAPEAALPPEPAFMASPSDQPQEDSMAPARTASWLRIGMRFEATALLLFCGLGFYLVARPAETERIIASVPLIDAALGTSTYLDDDITIAGLHGNSERLKDGRPAFIIVGEVTNNSNRVVGAVQIEGRLYGPQGEVARKAVYAGTRVSRRLVRSWTPAAIDMFEKLKPPKRYRLEAGASDDFLIIFQDAPAGLSEFSCRILAVQPVVGG